MQIANVLLSLGGDHGNQIMKHAVTAAEIAVLRAIHGDDAVQEVEPTGNVLRTHRAERERLLSTYGAAKSEEGRPIVESMFPGVAARVFDTLHELDLPDSFFKATGRQKAPVVANPQDGPTIDEWVKAGYSAKAYPPSGYVSKSTPDEIAAAVAAEALVEEDPTQIAPDDEVNVGDDGVGDDINDEHSETAPAAPRRGKKAATPNVLG